MKSTNHPYPGDLVVLREIQLMIAVVAGDRRVVVVRK